MSQETENRAEYRFQMILNVKDYLSEHHCSVAEACRAVGVSPSNYYRWRSSLSKNTEFLKNKAIEVKSRRPIKLARQVSTQIRQKVLEEEKDHRHKSANSIKEKLKENGICISTGKVIEILEENGLYKKIYAKKRNGEYTLKRGLARICEG